MGESREISRRKQEGEWMRERAGCKTEAASCAPVTHEGLLKWSQSARGEGEQRKREVVHRGE